MASGNWINDPSNTLTNVLVKSLPPKKATAIGANQKTYSAWDKILQRLQWQTEDDSCSLSARSAAVICLRTVVLDSVVAWSQRTSSDGFDSFSSKWFFHEEMTHRANCETLLLLCDVNRFTAWPATSHNHHHFYKAKSTQHQCHDNFDVHDAAPHSTLVTGRIAHSASRRYLIYSEADFEVFSTAGATRCTDGDGIWHDLLRAKFHPHRCNDKGVGPQKLKFLHRFDQNVEY